MKIGYFRRCTDGDVVAVAGGKYYSCKWESKLIKNNETFGPFQGHYRCELTLIYKGVKYQRANTYCYGEEEYAEVKAKQGYKEDYFEHMLLATANMFYKEITKKNEKKSKRRKHK